MIDKIKTWLLASIVLCLPALAQTAESGFTITYISIETVYIDAGRADGVEVGDSVAVIRDGREIAQLSIQFAAEHTAAAIIKHSTEDIKAGDAVLLLVDRPKEATMQAAPQRRRASISRPAVLKKESKVLISGGLALQWRHSSYTNVPGRTFDQPGVNFNLKARRLLGGGYELHIRGYSRNNRRSYSFGDRVPEQEWRHRLYTFSFAYTEKDAAVNYRIGRIVSNAISGVGYVDGLLLQGKLSQRWKIGGFGGVQPDWQNFAFQKEMKKYGVFVAFSAGESPRNRLQSTLALTGEYHSGTVSREFVFMRNRYTWRRISLYQTAEIDVNRDWRKTRAGESVSLTNFYFNVNGKITSALSAGLSYDNRKNYYTYSLRTIADSLFDDAMRYGLRGYVNLALPKQIHVYVNGGVRKREGASQNSYTVGLGARRNNFSPWKIFADVNAAGVFNYYLQGGYFSARVGKYYSRGNSVDFAYGGFYYFMPGAEVFRTTQWLRFSAYLFLSAHFYCRPFYEFNFGDDSPGQQVFVSLGYRF